MTFPVHHHCADYMFWSFAITEFIFSHFENRILLKPVLEVMGEGGACSVALFIIGHEQIQLNRVCYFQFFDVFLASK